MFNAFDLLGGENLDSYELMCDGQMCDPRRPNFVGMNVLASKLWKVMPAPFGFENSQKAQKEISVLS